SELQRRAEDAGIARVSVCCRPDRVAIVTAGAGICKNAIRVAARRTADSEVRVVPAGHGDKAKAARTHRQVVVVAAAICRELVVIGYGHGIPLSESRAPNRRWMKNAVATRGVVIRIERSEIRSYSCTQRSGFRYAQSGLQMTYHARPCPGHDSG